MLNFGSNCVRFPKDPYCFLKVSRTLRAKPVVKRVFNARKTKRIAKFDGIEGRRCQNIKRIIVAPEIGPRSFGSFEKQGPAPKRTSHNYDGLLTRELYVILVNFIMTATARR